MLVKFGLTYLPTYLPDHRDANTHFNNIVEQVVLADQIGLDHVWVVEHHFVRHGGLCAANYPILAYLAGRTSRIRLGTGATVLPLNDPIRVAEAAATIDILSNGRFELGIGRGFLRDEFDAFGVDMAQSRERLEEGVELIKQAWLQESVTYRGRFRPPIDGLSVIPKPRQKPHPPISVACVLTRDSFEWTAKEGYNLLYVGYHVDFSVARERVRWYVDALPKYGRRVEDYSVDYACHAFFQEHDDIAKLRSIVEKPMAEYAIAGAEASRTAPDPVAYKAYSAREDYFKQAAFEVYFPERVLMGGPDRVLERIKTLSDAGVTQISLIADFGSLSQTEIMRSLEIFGRDVLPRARQL